MLEAEGGWRLTNRLGDAGGVTYAGIAQGRNPHAKVFPEIVRLLGMPELNRYPVWPAPAKEGPNPPHVIGKREEEMLEAHPEVDGLRELVRDFFHDEFWRPIRAGEVEHQSLATAIYSEGVLSGIGRAARLIQAAAEVPVDGHVGPQTLAAVNAADPRIIARDFCSARWSWYMDLVVRRPSDLGNLRGWRNRAAKESGV